MEDPGWDPTTESFTLVQQVVGLLHAPLDKGLSYRLTLFLYSHVTEMADFYNVPANMLRICAGERYVINPFSTLPCFRSNSTSMGKADWALKRWGSPA